MRERKIGGLALLLALALLLGGWALAAGDWTCPNCGQQNSGNFCSNCGTPRPSAGDGAGDGFLLSWNGFTVEQKGMETKTSSDGSMELYLYTHVRNGTDRSIWLDADDVTVNGIPVTGSGKPGIAPGEELDVTIYFWPTEDNEAGRDAFRNPVTMTMNLNLKDSDNYEDLYERIITLSLGGLPSMTPKPTVRATPRPTVRPPKPTVSYHALVKGDEGEAVRRMQIELIRLGYLAGSADGKFGNQTQEAVREFAKANGLYSNDIATPEMQEVLFSSSAKAYEEPWVPLIIPYPSNGQWKKVSGNKMSFRFQVKNVSRTRTIKTFEVRVYALNAWGERIYGERTYYYLTNSKKVAPGNTVYTEYITLPNRSEVDKLYACVSRVVFTDGTIRENPEVNDYSDSWNINY